MEKRAFAVSEFVIGIVNWLISPDSCSCHIG